MKYFATAAFFSMIFSSPLFAQTFESVHLETMDYDTWASSGYKRYLDRDLSSCRFATYFNEDKQVIEVRIGVQGSNFDYFGWNMPIPLSDFPLRTGYSKEFKRSAGSTMLLTYDGTTLKFEYQKKDGLWSVLMPFEVTVNSTLTQPKVFKGKVAGFDTDWLGRPKKHMTQTCRFKP